MRRFVLLHHEMPAENQRSTHWDLMIENGNSLLTWSVNSLPTVGCSIDVEKRPNHRLLYLTYEGAVSDNRGRVRQVDSGWCEITTLSENRLIAKLSGTTLDGILRILFSTADKKFILSVHAHR